MRLSRRVRGAAVSATLAVKAEADRLRAQGADLVDLGLGEPDFDTPQHIKDAALQALRDNQTHYTAVEGIPQLRAAIAARYENLHGARYAPTQVLVSSGAKGALYAVLQALVDDGDEVAVFSPFWSSYPEQVKLAGGTPLIVATRADEHFLPSAARLAAAIGPKTRAVIVNSPCNPTGSVLPRDAWDALVDLALAQDLTLVCDEVYESFLYEGGPFVSAASSAERLGDKLVVVSSLSKTYAMTGWRLGYALGPTPLISAAATVQSHDASQASTISQFAGLAAITGDQKPLEAMLAEYASRRALLLPALQAIPGVRCTVPRGAFYAFPGVADLYGPLGVDSSAALAALLVRETGVVTVPGEGFGAPGFLRISYAAPRPVVQDGVARFADLVRTRR